MTGTEKKRKNGNKSPNLNEGDEKSVCKICKKSGLQGSLLKHIGAKKSCREKYGKEYDDMKAEGKKISKREYNLRNRIAINAKQNEYNKRNKDAINSKQDKYNNSYVELDVPFLSTKTYKIESLLLKLDKN